MSWIPFHDGLTEGDKRGLPRAIRFVYLELSLKSRPFAGRLPLPAGFKNDLDAVMDILGGNRREVAEALEKLTVPLDQTDPTDEPMIRLEGPKNHRVLVVVTHRTYVRLDVSTPRVRKHRADKKKRVTETVSETVSETGQRREEERREEEIPPTPQGGGAVLGIPIEPREVQSETRIVNATSDGMFGDTVSCWQAGVRRVTGVPYTRMANAAVKVLVDALLAHRPEGADPLEWAGDIGEEYAALRRGQQVNVFGFAEWLSSGKPNGKAKSTGNAEGPQPGQTDEQWREKERRQDQETAKRMREKAPPPLAAMYDAIGATQPQTGTRRKAPSDVPAANGKPALTRELTDEQREARRQEQLQAATELAKAEGSGK